jgi:rhodanese-related sulfurtransferase
MINNNSGENMKRLIGFFVAILILTNFVVCAQTAPPENNITVKELKTQMKENSDLIILDVRTPKELNGPLGKIDGIINIPVQELEKRVDELDKYKDKEIAVICRTGHRSSIGTKILMEHGFKKVENVKGGMTAYRNQ